MNEVDDLVKRIVSRSGIWTTRARRDLERELHAHLEDAVEEARSRGYEESRILQMVCERFGDPDEIAHQFADTRRLERGAVSIARSLAWMGISTLAVACLILTLQLVVSICTGFSPSKAFPHLLEEIVGFASLVHGYMGLYLEEPLFQQRRLVKAVVINSALFTLLFLLTFRGLHLHTLAPVVAFVSGVAVRTLQQSVIRAVWFLGTAVPMLAAGLAAGPLMSGNGHWSLWATALLRWTGLTLACYCLTLLSRQHHARSGDHPQNCSFAPS